MKSLPRIMTHPRKKTRLDPNTDFAARLVMLKNADRALLEGATQAEWKDAACTFFAAARHAGLRLVDFKFLVNTL
jgi:hypothetical protein